MAVPLSSHVEELDYRATWRAGDIHVGSHRSGVDGAGDEFRGIKLLGQGLDARRIDLRASIRDPWERPWVREFRQRSRISVMLLADLSSSMRFVGRADRLELIGRFAKALSQGASRRGDPFGFMGCDQVVRRDLLMAPTRLRQGGEIVARQLDGLRRASDLAPCSAEGLAQAARWMPKQRSLVFLLSDLYLDATLLARVLKSLALHEVVVVLLADSAEQQPPARWGLVRLADLETGRERLVFLRPGMAERMAAKQAERVAEAARLVHRQGATLLTAQDDLDLAAMARHFLSGGRT